MPGTIVDREKKHISYMQPVLSGGFIILDFITIMNWSITRRLM